MRNILFFLFASIGLVLSAQKKSAKFSVESAQVKIPQGIQFTNLSAQAKSYEWDFGDGVKSTEKDPIHHYKKSGIYHVSLKAMFGKKTKDFKMKIEVLHPDQCLVRIETQYGNMLVHLYDETPQHRDNFTKLAEEGFYQDLIFHRVISGFMIQGGDPDSRNANANSPLGSGGPGYTIPAEINKRFIHKKGALAAARTGDAVNPQKKSSGSQFYIVQGGVQTEDMLTRIEDQKGIKYSEDQIKTYTSIGGTPFLDQEYTVFGEVIEGLEVIDKIAAVQTGRADRPAEDVKMKIYFLH
ncbi:MAG: peptidylprolyl isomerase [Saprospiraceae bacterium]|nr:peptidylprolyl isomerase [Saprospiraceae bacterium]MBK7810908.1 peptidylprolyl isomerase [Saprospiraceae bacterium]MBK9630511.1 peptidylprolyl isomerase [Saprospiraceae bacterium]